MGQYTMAFYGGTNGQTQPYGNSFGTITVDKAGKVRFAGTLSDGTKVTQSVPLAKGGDWPFYLPVYGGKGLAAAWLLLDSAASDPISGERQRIY